MSSLLFSTPHSFINRMPLPSPLPCDFADPPEGYVDCTSLGHHVWSCWLTCFGHWKFSRHDKQGLEVNSCDMSQPPVLLPFVRRRTWAMSHGSWNEETPAAELDIIHVLELCLASPSSPGWATADQQGQEQGLTIVAGLWALEVYFF